MKIVNKRKASIDFKSINKILITTPFKQKEFSIEDGVTYIDLISLKVISMKDVGAFFVEMYKEDNNIRGIVFSQSNRGLDEIDSIIPPSAPKCFTATVIEDD